MRRTLSSERGGVIVTAVLLLAVMMTVGLAALSQVDGQQRESRKQRERESSFNLAEASLTTQIYILGRKGPGTASRPYPVTCPTAGNEFCPDTANLAENYDAASQPDFGTTSAWRTWVRDNASGMTPDTFWQDSLLTTRPSYDANADKLMWVRAQAQVRGRARAMVGLIRIEPRPVTFPGYTILAGKFRTTNNGNHAAAIVDTTGSSLGVAVRCNGAVPSAGCIDYKHTRGQISPNTVSTGYSEDQAVSADDLAALMDVARSNGTYYTSCPSNLTGAVVVLDPGGATECAFQGNTSHNSLADPGLVILASGKIEFRGTTNFYGLVYHPNLSNSTAWDLVRAHGNAQINGGVIVDGPGGVEAGSSGKLNLKFNANAFNDINSFGTAGVVQNTWREIQPAAL
jgi:type II secretory pathway pseudopilin PulG